MRLASRELPLRGSNPISRTEASRLRSKVHVVLYKQLLSGVPQGPQLFSSYTDPLGRVIRDSRFSV